ncbi:L-lactate permease [Micromonospora sp. WMMD1082]|uniref:L-lactate permease n=1 Tax=Micromonospora sp. WMMD1082 TaxID=3016104 RepID=UPI002417A065|nr:L-lactate permease [Micromonospora sp. WMMD1082]MDG4796835.1 L-lactate permease [Micromonospora sp. WMMD1082]
MYRPILDPLADSLALSALVAGLPIVTLFLLLGVARVRAWLAAFGALTVALVVSILVYSMPAGQALLTASQGATFALFPLVWTFGTAIWIYRMTVTSGHFDVLRRSFARVSDDQHVQALVIAFCFGSLLEGLAGQGTPVAITTVMLLALGFGPMKAATVALVANTVPAAFGPLGLPITTLARVTDLPTDELGAMAGRQVPVIALFIPLLLVGMVGGRRGLRRTWHVAVSCGLSFALAQFLTSNYFAMALADIVAGLVSAVVVTVIARVWPPQRRDDPLIDTAATDGPAAPAPVGPVTPDGPDGPVTPDGPGTPGGPDRGVAVASRRVVAPHPPDAPAEVWRAYAPYLVIVAIFGLSQVPAIADALNAVTVTFDWPGLHLLTVSGAPSTLPVFRFNWLSSTGTLLVLAGLVTMAILRVTPRTALVAYGQTLASLRWAILTVCGLLALAFVMNGSGQTATLGTWMAGAGGLFALLSPILGWLGVALTGSDTSSNSLFGALQVTAAQRAGLDPVLLAAANASGGVVGKMISLQNLTIAASAVGLNGREGDLFRRMFGWSVVLICAMALLVGLQATPLLSWMVP